MAAPKSSIFLPLALLFVLLSSFNSGGGVYGLDADFYNTSCPDVAKMVWTVVSRAMVVDPRIGASLVRLHFHDCFVQGCDASILLDNSSTIITEKDAPPNKNSARGFEVVDDIKQAIEEECPGVVSCADILALAAEASVSLGGGPSWTVPLGRIDSLSANASLASSLPSPFGEFQDLQTAFSEAGLGIQDLVALSGAHTFGKGHCQFFVKRLYDFNHTGKADPRLNSTYLKALQRQCPEDNPDGLVDLDGGCGSDLCEMLFDNQYFKNLMQGKGLFNSDAALMSSSIARNVIVEFNTNTSRFFEAFISSMLKMSSLSPFAGSGGEVRKSCRVVNPA